MLIGEPESLLRDLVFARQRGTEHGRIVAVQSDHHTAVKIILCRMFAETRAEPGAHVAGKADFDRNLALGKLFHKIGIVEGGEAVADALGAQIERAPYGFRWPGLAGVCGQAHAVIGGPGIGVTEEFRRSFLLIAAYTDANDLAVVIADCELENFLRSLGTELPNRVED